MHQYSPCYHPLSYGVLGFNEICGLFGALFDFWQKQADFEVFKNALVFQENVFELVHVYPIMYIRVCVCAWQVILLLKSIFHQGQSHFLWRMYNGKITIAGFMCCKSEVFWYSTWTSLSGSCIPDSSMQARITCSSSSICNTPSPNKKEITSRWTYP